MLFPMVLWLHRSRVLNFSLIPRVNKPTKPRDRRPLGWLPSFCSCRPHWGPTNWRLEFAQKSRGIHRRLRENCQLQLNLPLNFPYITNMSEFFTYETFAWRLFYSLIIQMDSAWRLDRFSIGVARIRHVVKLARAEVCLTSETSNSSI